MKKKLILGARPVKVVFTLKQLVVTAMNYFIVYYDIKVMAVLYMTKLEAVSQQQYVSCKWGWGSEPTDNAISAEVVADHHEIL